MEISVLIQSQCCPQLIKYHESHVLGSKLWIAMEYIDRGSVLNIIKRRPLKEAEIAVIIREVVLGLKHLKDQNKMHRDVKAANVLLKSTGEVRLADFGASQTLTSTMSKRNTFVGSPYWMAPEIFTSNRSYDYQADIWSLAITAMELTTGKPPNHHLPHMKFLFHTAQKPPPTLPAGQFSKEFEQFLQVCLVKDPNARATLADVMKLDFIKNAGSTSTLKFEDIDFNSAEEKSA
jgi:serine/threonine-protein kinase 24/25/MST4